MAIVFDPFTGQIIDTGSSSGGGGSLTIGSPISGATANSVLISDASSNLDNVQMSTDGQLLIGSTGTFPVAATLTQVSSDQVVITNGPGSISLGLPQDINTTSSPTFANLYITNKTITVNKNGATTSGSLSGIEIEENSLITGYVKTSNSRNSWELKSPGTAGIVTVTPGISGFTIDQGSHDPITIGSPANGLSLSGQVLSIGLSSASANGALSSTDWTTFNGKPSLTSTAAQSVSTSNTAGSATDAAKSDHTHRGVASFAKNGSTALYGDVTISASSGITLVQSGNDISIAATTGGGGTVTDVSVVSANGFAGTVANSTTTPAITLTTSITGVLKGNGTAISAALAGTDYQAPITQGNLSEATSSVLTISGGSNAVIGSGTSIQVKQSSSTQSGYLSSTDWSTFNNKEPAITGAATSITSSNLTASRVLTSDASGKVAASSVTDTTLGYLDATSSIQTQLNGKEPTLTKGNLTEATSSVLTISGGSNAVIGSGTSIQVKQSSSSQSGYLSSTDWSTFNGKPNLTSTAAQSVSTSNTAGSATDAAKSDHTHRGVASFAKSGDSALYGDVTISAGTGVTLTQTGNNISIASTGGGGGQESIQFQEDGVNLGTSGTVNTVTFTTGTKASAVRNSNTVTVDISNYNTYYDNGTSDIINFNNGSCQKISLDSNLVIEFINPTQAGEYYILVTSSGSYKLTIPSEINVEGGPLPAFTSGQSRLLRVVYDTSYHYTISFTAAFTYATQSYILRNGGYTSSGVLKYWGTNNLSLPTNGVNTNIGALSPTKLATAPIGLFSDYSRTSNRGFGIDAANGMIYAWGNNTAGTLGNFNGSGGSSVSSPVTIARSSSYNMVSTGNSAVYAIDAADGKIWGWGDNASGRLGNNQTTITSYSSPVTIARSGSYSKVVATRSGNAKAYGIDNITKMIYAWGNNTASGVLGVNTATVDYSSPVTIARSSSYSDVSAWVSTAYGLDSVTNMIWTWGGSNGGALGNNTTTAVSSPVTIARSTSYSAISAGPSFAYAIDKATGMIWAWGVGTSGQLGNNTLTSISSPVTIARSASYTSVIAGNNVGFAVDSDDVVWAWGDNTNSNRLFTATDIGIPSLNVNVLSPSAITQNVFNNFTIFGGYGSNGDIDNATNTLTYYGAPIAAAGSGVYVNTSYTNPPFGLYSSGGSSNYAIDATNGMIYSWGDNTSGKLGNNSGTPTFSSPVTIARSASYSLVVGQESSAYAIDGTTKMIWAWGGNAYGFGDNTLTTVYSSPVTIARSSSYSQIALADDSTLALDDTTGMIWAWGRSSLGTLGINSTTGTKSSPLTIARSTSYKAIAAGTSTAYAIDAATDMIWAWGSGVTVGNNATTGSVIVSSPVTIARSGSYSKVVATQSAAAAIDKNTGMIWAWGAFPGNNVYSVSTPYSSPVTIARSASYSQLVASQFYDIFHAVDAVTGVIYTWGSGQLGKGGNIPYISSPVSIGKIYQIP